MFAGEQDQILGYQLELAEAAHGQSTIAKLLDMTAALRFDMDYPNPDSDVQTEDRCTGWRPRLSGDQEGTLGQQTLRLYERKGLLEPWRTGGGKRRYSDAGLVRLRRIAVLLTEGLNLAGIGIVLQLEAANAQLHLDLAAARANTEPPAHA